MAFRALAFRRGAVAAAGQTRRFATATTADGLAAEEHAKSWDIKGQFAPVSVVLGLVLVAVSFGVHTAKQQLVNAPGVTVRKKKRSEIQEVVDPTGVAGRADRFINKSVLRKVAHLQDFDKVRSGITDPTRPDPFTQKRNVESLKSVGIDPRGA